MRLPWSAGRCGPEALSCCTNPAQHRTHHPLCHITVRATFSTSHNHASHAPNYCDRWSPRRSLRLERTSCSISINARTSIHYVGNSVAQLVSCAGARNRVQHDRLVPAKHAPYRLAGRALETRCQDSFWGFEKSFASNWRRLTKCLKLCKTFRYRFTHRHVVDHACSVSGARSVSGERLAVLELIALEPVGCPKKDDQDHECREGRVAYRAHSSVPAVETIGSTSCWHQLDEERGFRLL